MNESQTEKQVKGKERGGEEEHIKIVLSGEKLNNVIREDEKQRTKKSERKMKDNWRNKRRKIENEWVKKRKKTKDKEEDREKKKN